MSPSPVAAATGLPRPLRLLAGELQSRCCAAAVSCVKTRGPRLQDSSRCISANACSERVVFFLFLHLLQASDRDCSCQRCNTHLWSAGLHACAAAAAQGIPSLLVSLGKAGPAGRAGHCSQDMLPPSRPAALTARGSGTRHLPVTLENRKADGRTQLRAGWEGNHLA